MAEVRAFRVSTDQEGSSHLTPNKYGASHVGTREICSAQIPAGQICAIKIAAGQARFAKINGTKVATSQVAAFKHERRGAIELADD